MFKGLKEWYAGRKLRQLSDTGRIRSIMNYHQARDIGILYESSSESMFILVKQFVEYLKKEHGIKDVLAMGYIEAKEVPRYHSHILNHDFFTRKDMSWYGNPKSRNVQDFISREFDILIDMSDGNIFPLRFILERSAARFKVGRNASNESYDLCVQAKEGGTLDQSIKQMNRVLTSINHHEERQRV